jgi:hypothetical protein
MPRETLKSPTGIAMYCNVFKARARKAGDNGETKGNPKFSVLLVFDKKADLSEMEEAVEAAAVEKFGSKAKKMLETGKIRNPIRDAEDYVDEEKSDEENFPFNLPRAKMIRFAKNEEQGAPGVVDADAEPLMDKSEFYSGCKARVSCRAYAYDQNGNKGVSFALINVQKIDDGERLGGSDPDAASDFGSGGKKPKKSGKGGSVDDML